MEPAFFDELQCKLGSASILVQRPTVVDQAVLLNRQIYQIGAGASVASGMDLHSGPLVCRRHALGLEPAIWEKTRVK